MLCTIIGMLLKLVGVILAIPNTIKNFNNWKTKEVAKLWEANSVYNRRGVKPTTPRWKRLLYKLARMPNPHLWDRRYDRTGKKS